MSTSEIKGLKLKFTSDDEAECVDPDCETYENCLTGPCQHAEIADVGFPQLTCNLAELPVFSYLWNHGGCPERKWEQCPGTISQNTTTKNLKSPKKPSQEGS